MTPTACRIAGCTVLLVTFLAFLHSGSAAQAPPTAAASGSASHTITVDTIVLDASGHPVPGLGAADFDVSVDGKSRRVVSAEYIDWRAARPAPQIQTGRDLVFSSNVRETDTAAPAKTVVLAVDQSSFLPGRGRQTLDAAVRFLERQDPSARVALAVFPDPITLTRPTRDRRGVAAALARVSGNASSIVAPGMNVSMSLGEAVEIAAGNQLTRSQVFARECGGYSDGTTREACLLDGISIAQATVTSMQSRAVRSLVGFNGVLAELQAVHGRKDVVLVSAGLFQASNPQDRLFVDELRRASALAASAEATVHVLHVDMSMSDIFGTARARISETGAADRSLLTQGLESLAVATGGLVFRLTSDATSTFERVAQATAATYRLGLDSTTVDRDGRGHTLRVRVSRRGTTVRHHPVITSDTMAPAGIGLEQRVDDVLRTGQVVRDLPLHLATYTFADAASGGSRVLVRADIGGATVAADVVIGLALVNETGRVVGRTVTRKYLVPDPESADIWPYSDTLIVPPGRYSLRAVVAEPTGRLGSVVHTLQATIAEGDGARLSDILVVDLEHVSPDRFFPVVDGRLRGRTASMVVEVYPGPGTDVSTVTFSVRADADAAPLLTRDAALTKSDADGRVTALAELDLAPLPAGEYVVVAEARHADRTLARTTRPIATASGPVPSPAAAAGGPRLRFAPGAEGSLGKPFERIDVLGPQNVGYFLDRLAAADAAPRSATLESAMMAAREADYPGVLAALAHEPDTRLAVTFLRGLAYFARGDLRAAADQFRASLDRSSAFLPSAFYLGACYAAGGRDEQAVGAWQTALVTEADARIVYDVLADALARLNDGAELLGVVSDARTRWPDDDLLLPRFAAGLSLTGKPAEAVGTIERYLAAHPTDAGAAMLGLRILYDAHQAGTPVLSRAEDAAAAERLVARYREASGPDQGLVERWAAAVGASRPRR